MIPSPPGSSLPWSLVLIFSEVTCSMWWGSSFWAKLPWGVGSPSCTLAPGVLGVYSVTCRWDFSLLTDTQVTTCFLLTCPSLSLLDLLRRSSPGSRGIFFLSLQNALYRLSQFLNRIFQQLEILADRCVFLLILSVPVSLQCLALRHRPVSDGLSLRQNAHAPVSQLGVLWFCHKDLLKCLSSFLAHFQNLLRRNHSKVLLQPLKHKNV